MYPCPPKCEGTSLNPAYVGRVSTTMKYMRCQRTKDLQWDEIRYAWLCPIHRRR